jgi:VIT1/CCC1 family predicted Fe2+/Mn2+ transporter
MMHMRGKFYIKDGPEFGEELEKCHNTDYARKHGLRFCKLAGTGDWDYLLREMKFKATIRRTGFGILGGLFLVVPMLIMTLHQSRNTSLITVCISTLIFTIVVSVFSKAKEHEVIGIVAAYAAVLVVFVGTST